MHYSASPLLLATAILSIRAAAIPSGLPKDNWVLWGFTDGCPSQEDMENLSLASDGFIDAMPLDDPDCTGPTDTDKKYKSLVIWGVEGTGKKLSVYSGGYSCANDKSLIFSSTEDGCKILSEENSIGSYQISSVK